MRRVFVTGGTGFVGSHVVKKLVERGDHVIALARPKSDMRLLKELPIEIAHGDITDIDSLMWPMKRIDELYHVAADYRLWASNPEEIYTNNVVGTLNVMEGALRMNVPRVVYTSTVGCLGLPGDDLLGDENTPVRRNELVGHYKKSKYDAEQVTIEYATKGLPVVIVNPSTPVGPGDVKPTPTGKIVLDFINGGMRGYVDTGLNLAAVEDVADGHLLAAQKGRIGERYILGNLNLSLQDILCILASITGKAPPTLRVPYWVALVAALVNTASSQLTGKQPGVPVEGVQMAKKKMFFSSAKAVTELGLPQSSVEDALARSVKWFVDNGYAKK